MLNLKHFIPIFDSEKVLSFDIPFYRINFPLIITMNMNRVRSIFLFHPLYFFITQYSYTRFLILIIFNFIYALFKKLFEFW
jgi:hypothetical protein